MPYFDHQGRRCNYREEGSGPLLLILHGNTASSALHGNELAFFSGLGYRVVALDFPGCGQSDPVPAPWPLNWWQQNAHVVIALLDALEGSQAILCGCSGGAITALLTAILYPDRVQAVIADSLSHFYPHGHLTREVENRAARTPGQVSFWSAAHGPGWEKVVDADSDLFTRLDPVNPEGVRFFEDRLSEICCPVLFTVSLRDSLLYEPGEQAAEMAAQVPGSWLFAVNEGDHPLTWSSPAVFQGAAREFLVANH